MNILALDIGKKKTGAAFADTSSGVIFALDTIEHADDEELIDAVKNIVQEKKITEIVCGLPLRLSGGVGTQAAFAQAIADKISQTLHISVRMIDERYTSSSRFPCVDDNAVAACTIAEIALSKR